MMEQLGITKLRPGPSGNENAPNHANYDEAQANPYPNLPDVLTTKDGKKVKGCDAKVLSKAHLKHFIAVRKTDYVRPTRVEEK